MNQSMPKIYAAGKIWHAPHFKELRDMYDFPIVSRWIDIEGDSSSPARYNGREVSREEIWNMCLDDVRRSDIMVLWCGDYDEDHRGTIMEAGHAFAFGRRVFCINTAKPFSPCEISDVAFTHHRLWTFVRESDRWIDPLEGFSVAVSLAMGVSEIESNVILGPWGVVRHGK